MSRKYTSLEMREVAKSLLSSEVNLDFDKRDVAAMLRQAADALESKRKYEYIVKYFRKRSGRCCGQSAAHFAEEEVAGRMAELLRSGYTHDGEVARLYRREIGEWEEVKDEK